jgi:peptidoglycan/LPS O-acetylase OafA/YrhL|tara:strand:- start:172 stop:987 length:816 start_codon:yes stop_codon:yes gene_type:complete
MKGSYSHHRETIEQHKAITYRKIKSDFTSSSTFYHLGIPGFPFAYFEVDLFLVVNGYLMAMLYGEIKSKAEVIDFFVRKGARLLPAYFTVLALTAIVGVLLLLPREIEHLMTQGIWSAVVLPNFGFWQSAVYFDSIMLRPLLDLWSLGVELQFYLVFPLLLLVKRVNEKWLIVFAVVSFLIAVATSTSDPKTAFFLLPSRLREFMVGYYTYRLISQRGITNNTLGLAALLALLALLFTLSAVNPDPVFLANAVVVLLSAAVIELGCPPEAI